MNAAFQLYGSQRAYDDAEPCEAPLVPEFDSEINDLMTGVDTDLLSYDGFANAAEEDLYDMVPDRFVIQLILAASRSSDTVLRGMTKEARGKLEELAGRMLETTWKKEHAA